MPNGGYNSSLLHTYGGVNVFGWFWDELYLPKQWIGLKFGKAFAFLTLVQQMGGCEISCTYFGLTWLDPHA